MRIPPTILALMLGVGCASTGVSRPSVTPPVVEEPMAADDEATAAEAMDPIRQDYRMVLAQCEDFRDAEATVDSDERRRRRRETVVAAAAYAIGEATDVDNDSDQPLGTMGGQAECPRDRDPSRPGPCIQETPVVATSEGLGPATGDEDATTPVDPEESVTTSSIQGAVVETDDFLFANPEPNEWSEEQRAEWATRRNRLAQLCGYTAAGPGGMVASAEPEAEAAAGDVEVDSNVGVPDEDEGQAPGLDLD